MFRDSKRADNVVLMFSVIAVLVAATLTAATITNNPDKSTILDESTLFTPNPLKRAETAAIAAIDEAKYHIECHGRIKAGRLSPRFYVNGATYSAEWGDVNLADSTVIVKTNGEFSWGGDKHYRVEREVRIKIGFLPTHRQEILGNYYSGNIPRTDLSEN